MRPTAVLLAIFAFYLCRPTHADSLPPPTVPQCVGVNIHFTGAPSQDLDGLARGGFGWVRMDFAWDGIEKVKGQYDFSAYDALVAGLASRNIRPLFILDYGNDLYQTGAPRLPESRAAFARFAAAAVTHYKGQPILWEIWNEPNGGFWKPQANAAEYGRLALETARAIKQADPHATVLAPGTAGIPLDFLETVFQTGILRYLDAVSLHPYRGDHPESAAADYPAVRRLIRKYAPPGRVIPLVSSEWGYSTVNVTEEQQAKYLPREWLSNLAAGVRLSIWYDWHEDGPDPKEPEHHFGTVRPDYAPKPAFEAARRLTEALGGYRFVKRLPLMRDGDYLLLFARGASVQIAYWTTDADHPAVLPGGRRLALTGSPQYLDVSADAALRTAAAWSVSPNEVFYASGQTPALAVAYQSLDGRGHRARLLLAVTTLDRWTKQVSSSEDTAGPGQALRWEGSVPGLARVPARIRVGLEVDGIRQPYSQEAVFTPTDPLELAVAPLLGGRFQARVTNPAGTAFTGRLGPSAGSGHSVPVRLASGRMALDLTLRAGVGEFLLQDELGKVVARSSALRFVPLTASVSSFTAARDGDAKVASSVHLRPGVGPGGDPALRVDYNFASGWSFFRFGNGAQKTLAGKPVGLGLWIYGDGSGNAARARFVDATGQTLQANGLPIDWHGWRFVTFRLVRLPGGTSDLGFWGGASDGQVHYPVRLDTVFLLDSRADAVRHAGALWIKQPTLLYDPGL